MTRKTSQTDDRVVADAEADAARRQAGSTPGATADASTAGQAAKAAQIDAGAHDPRASDEARANAERAKAQELAQLQQEQARTEADQRLAAGVDTSAELASAAAHQDNAAVTDIARGTNSDMARQGRIQSGSSEGVEAVRAPESARPLSRDERMQEFERLKGVLADTLSRLERGAASPSIGVRRGMDMLLDEMQILASRRD